MDIFKLIFEHDLRLDELRERKLDRSVQEVSGSIEDFLKPDPTYSKFYFTGTKLPDEQFGINEMESYSRFLNTFCGVLSGYKCFIGSEESDLAEAVEKADIGKTLILTREDENRWTDLDLDLNNDSNVGHKKSELAKVLESDDLVLYKENAHNGFDLHLFSRKNIYVRFFKPFQELLSDRFRFFSINGKKVRSERKFYFETWTLHRPPHGAEEVLPDTVL